MTPAGEPAPQPLRVAVVVADSQPFRLLLDLVDASDPTRLRFEPVALDAADGPLREQLAERGLALRCVGHAALQDVARAAWQLRRLLGASPPDVVHTHFFVPGLATALALWQPSPPPWVLTRHHNLQHHYERRRVHRAIDTWCARRADAVIAVSAAVERTLVQREGVPRERVQLVHHGIAWDRLPTSAGRVARWRDRFAGKLLLVAVGRIDRVKDLPTLLRAVAAVRRVHPTVHLAVAGTGPDDEAATVRATVVQLGLEGSVDLLGYVEDAAALVAAADVFVQASIDESFSLSILEALGLGVPVAVTTTGAIPELLEGTGYAPLPAGRPDLLAARILACLADLPAARAQAEALAPSVRDRFGLARVLREHEAVYRQLVDRRSGGQRARRRRRPEG